MTEPPHPHQPLVERERRLLAALGTLLADRAARAEAAETELARAAAGAAAARDRALAAAEDAYRAATGLAQAAFDSATAAAAEKYAADSAAADKRRKDESRIFKERAEQSEASARKKLQDAVWLAESVYDTAKDRPRLECEARKKEIEAILAQATASEKDAGQWLADHRQRPLPAAPTVEPTSSGPESFKELSAAAGALDAAMKRLDSVGAARLFAGANVILPPILLAAVGGTAVAAVRQWRIDTVTFIAAGAGLVLGVLLLVAMLGSTRRRTAAAAADVAAALARVRTLAESAREHAREVRKAQETAHLEKRDSEIARAKKDAGAAVEVLRQRIEQERTKISAEHARQRQDVEQARATADAAAGTSRQTALGAAERARDTAVAEAISTHQRVADEANRAAAASRAAIAADWSAGQASAAAEIESISRIAHHFPAWTDPAWEQFAPPGSAPGAVPVASVGVRVAEMPGGLPPAGTLARSVPDEFTLPVPLVFPERASLLIQSGPEGRSQGVRILQNAVLRLLSSFPPGKVRFTLADPVGLGQSFAGFMHLSDYEAAIVGDKIWTEPRHIEQKLTDLTEHMEDVIQKYLRNEYATIDEYNAQAGEVAEPYRFLVLADFPTNLTEQAAKRLASIVASGPRCGVYTLILADARQKPPQGLHMSDLEKAAGVRLVHRAGRFVWDDAAFAHLPLHVEEPPDESAFTALIHRLGASLKDSTRVQVPFALVAPGDGEVWTRRTDREIEVPIGRAGASKIQQLTLGRGTAQHTLIAGRTGSGKSTLLHAIITSAVLWYGPDQVELYLVDFKKGVEFKTYATRMLPHARVIAIESEREFGLSVLRRLDAELKRRGVLFRDAGVQDLAGFRSAQPQVPMPRSLLIVDEFQELFVEDDKLAQESALLLDRLVRQGRAFGMHVVLGSQTLGGAYSLARSTIGQMAVRIALQCSEADAYLIMSDDNSAPRLLSRPGEAIYNDASGAVEGNSPFQVVWLPDEERDDFLGMVETARARLPTAGEAPIVFEGNVPADIRRFAPLAALLDPRTPPSTAPAAPKVWLGDPVSIKEATAAALRRQSGANVLIVGQKDESALAMMACSMIGLAAQEPAAAADAQSPRFIVLDGTPADVPHAGMLAMVAGMLPHATLAPEYRDAGTAIARVHEELQRRKSTEGGAEAAAAPGVYLFINGLQRFRILRKKEDDFGFSGSGDGDAAAAPPDKMFAEILADGPPLGIHTIVWCDTVTNLDRTLQRQSMREFDVRVLFQMSSTDSSALIDGPAAGLIGQNRALFHSEEQGVLEKFRPWAVPTDEWLERVRAAFSIRTTTAKSHN